MRRKKEAEYHTGRLNISCPPSVKDAIAETATAHNQSISQYIISLYEKSNEAGSSEHLARMGLDLIGIKKSLVEIDARLRKAFVRNPGLLDPATTRDIAQLRELQAATDIVLKETVEAVKMLKEQGK